MRRCKTEAKNRYRNARLVAAKSNKQLSSMELASEQLFISRRTLWEIENGINVPSADLVNQMAKVYQMPELLHWYCHSECPIGKKLEVQPVAGMEPELIALHALCLAKTARQIAENMAESIRKGEVAGSASSKFITWSGEVAQLGRELTVVLEKRRTL